MTESRQCESLAVFFMVCGCVMTLAWLPAGAGPDGADDGLSGQWVAATWLSLPKWFFSSLFRMFMMTPSTDDLRIVALNELAPPAHLIREFPVTEAVGQRVNDCRQAIHRILHGRVESTRRAGPDQRQRVGHDDHRPCPVVIGNPPLRTPLALSSRHGADIRPPSSRKVAGQVVAKPVHWASRHPAGTADENAGTVPVGGPTPLACDS